jgi:timeless protein
MFFFEFLKGYGTLVGELHQQLLKQGDAHPLDKSHFLWLISYFLPIACQLNDVNMEHLKGVLTIDLLCYLTWEAVRQTEKLEMCALQPYSAAVDLKANARRLHLCVKAIREYLKTLERLSRRPNLNNSGFTQIGCENSIIQLDGYVPAIRDLRQLFLLQLRQFNPIVQCRSYLVDVISANHILLLTLERISSHQQQPSFDFNQHLTQFCSKTILDRYGTALEDFKNNGPYVNDCILTLLYHVAGDLGGLDLLCEPAILRPFSEIWKQEFDVNNRQMLYVKSELFKCFSFICRCVTSGTI